MLCYHNSTFGDICTNRCPKRSNCTKKRLPFLIEFIDVLPSDIEYGENEGSHYISIDFYCIAPEAYINELIFSMLDNEQPMVCFVPCIVCGSSVMMKTTQKESMTIENMEKYNKLSFPCCSVDCQSKFLRKAAGSKTLASGSLKNHEYALIIHGADTTKRPKEKEIHLITGTVTEQRARSLFEKLHSVTPMKNRKFLTSNEVQMFLINDLPANIRANKTNIRVAAWDVMNKCKQLYPNDILVEHYRGKSREILLIK